jgi:exosome complex component RRP41
MVSAVSAGIVDNQVLVDLDYAEEAHEEGDVADIPIAMIPSTEEITLLQMDGKIGLKNLMAAIAMVKPQLKAIAEIQRKALKERYK